MTQNVITPSKSNLSMRFSLGYTLARSIAFRSKGRYPIIKQIREITPAVRVPLVMDSVSIAFCRITHYHEQIISYLFPKIYETLSAHSGLGLQ
jgi:hypothetical protein